MALTLLCLALPLGASAGGPYAVCESDSDFATVMEGAKMAIQERGMYINNLMHMGEMLERTGKDLGMAGQIYGDAESIEFCSAVLSRRMTMENPARIDNCPFIIAVYTLPHAPDKTYVAHKAIAPEEIAGSEVMAEVAEMLKGVADAAISW